MSIIQPAMDKNSPDWCEACQKEHGPLFICDSYSEERKAKIRKSDEAYRKCLRDPKWIQKQMDNGVPPEAIEIFKALAGEE